MVNYTSYHIRNHNFYDPKESNMHKICIKFLRIKIKRDSMSDSMFHAHLQHEKSYHFLKIETLLNLGVLSIFRFSALFSNCVLHPSFFPTKPPKKNHRT